jgi:hypothetical protein
MPTRRATSGWSPAENVYTQSDENGTSYDWDHGDRRYRVRIYASGEVHLWIDGGHYELRGGATHETVKSFSTNVTLVPVEE